MGSSCSNCDNEIANLRAEVERLKTELADTKRIYGNPDSTNEQKWVALEKHCEVLEGAIREAIKLIKGDCAECSIGVISPCDRCTGEAANVLEKAVNQ